MGKKTKEKILWDSLDLFSQNGYYGTSMNDIAEKVGITKAALYKHFSGKEKIFEELLNTGEERYEKNFGSDASPPEIPGSAEALMKFSMNQIEYTLHDTDIVKFRKLFVIEQFRDERIAELATRHFDTGVERMYSLIFSGMMKKGVLKQEDPDFLAFEYVAPITVMIHLCDRYPEWEGKVMERIRRHIKKFLEIYGTE